MRPTVDQLVSKMTWDKGRNDRNDWSDEGNESMVENDMRSIASAKEMGNPRAKIMPHVKEQLQQNSLFSSVGNHGNTSISISGGNSILPVGDSRLK